jgi:hypothetical protein
MVNVPLPIRVVLVQSVVTAVLALAVSGIGLAAALSVIAGAVSCVLPGALIAQWTWRRGLSGMVVAGTQPVFRLLLSAAMFMGLLSLAKVHALAALAGFVVATIVQPVVLIWASSRHE